MAGYAFGDSARAAERLALLAETFAASSESFLRRSCDRGPELAADLGCGPGHTTRLLAGVLCPGLTIGFDRSENFLARARASATARVMFERHDVTRSPFPHAPFDLMFARFVLTHLPDPESVVAAWADQLRPGGILAIEEVESIESPIPEFVTYLGIQQSMLSSQGNALCVGPRLGAIAGLENARLQDSRIAYLDVPAARAAGMFQLNLATVREHEFVRGRHDAAAIDELAAGLRAIAAGERGPELPEVRWGLRQMVLAGTAG